MNIKDRPRTATMDRFNYRTDLPIRCPGGDHGGVTWGFGSVTLNDIEEKTIDDLLDFLREECPDMGVTEVAYGIRQDITRNGTGTYLIWYGQDVYTGESYAEIYHAITLRNWMQSETEKLNAWMDIT